MISDLNTISFTSVLWFDIVKSKKSKVLIILCGANRSDRLAIELANPKSVFIEKLKSFEIIFSSIELFTVTPLSEHIVLVRFEGSDDKIHGTLNYKN
jgi:hypothetical protein